MYFLRLNTRSPLAFCAITDQFHGVQPFIDTNQEGVQAVGKLIRSPEQGKLAAGFNETWQ